MCCHLHVAHCFKAMFREQFTQFTSLDLRSWPFFSSVPWVQRGYSAGAVGIDPPAQHQRWEEVYISDHGI